MTASLALGTYRLREVATAAGGRPPVRYGVGGYRPQLPGRPRPLDCLAAEAASSPEHRLRAAVRLPVSLVEADAHQAPTAWRPLVEAPAVSRFRS